MVYNLLIVRVRLVLIFSFLFFSFLSVPLVSAQDESATASAIKVGHVAGRPEKLREKLILFFKFNKKDKADYYQFLAEKRIAELAYVIESNQIDLVEPTASRYSTYIGTLTDFVTKNNITAKKEDLIEMFERHQKVVGKLQEEFKFESGWWLALQHDINTARLFKEKVEKL